MILSIDTDSSIDDEGIGHLMTNISNDMLIMTRIASDIGYVNEEGESDFGPEDLDLMEEMLDIRAKRTTRLIEKITQEAKEILKIPDIEKIRKKFILYHAKVWNLLGEFSY